MQYKVIAPPSNLPMFDDSGRNGRVISWVLAEKYKKWNLSAILEEYPNHWAVGTRVEQTENLKPLSECSSSEKKSHKISEKRGIIFVEVTTEEETIKILSECSEKEKSQHNIVEKDEIIYLKMDEKWENLKPIIECS